MEVEVTTLYGLLAVIVTSIGTPVITHILQSKKMKRSNEELIARDQKQIERDEKLDAQIETLLKKTKDTDLITQRLDMAVFMNSNPFEYCTDLQRTRIANRYKKYKDAGGNDWFDDVYDAWLIGSNSSYTIGKVNQIVEFCEQQHNHKYNEIKK